jgi:hypothetical protein
LKKKLNLAQFKQKIIYLFLIISITLLTASCTKPIQNNINGKWTDIENKYLVLIIDSISGEITLDYSISGGKKFTSKYIITPKNEIISNLFPYSAKFLFDENGYLKIEKTKKIYSRDLEIVYFLKFKKIKE